MKYLTFLLQTLLWRFLCTRQGAGLLGVTAAAVVGGDHLGGPGKAPSLVQVMLHWNLGGGADSDPVAGRLKEGPSDPGSA